MTRPRVRPRCFNANARTDRLFEEVEHAIFRKIEIELLLAGAHMARVQKRQPVSLTFELTQEWGVE